MAEEYRPLSRRTLLTAAAGGVAAGLVSTSLLTGTAAAAVPGRKRLLIGNVDALGNGSIAVADPSLTGAPSTIAVSGQPNSIAGAPDGIRAWVATQFTPGLALVDLDKGKVETEVMVGGFANNTVVSADGKRAYVSVGSSGGGGSRGHVAVVDTATAEVRARIKVGFLPSQLALTPDGKRLYVADATATGVSIIDTAKNEVAGAVKTAKAPLRIAIDAKGTKLYVASFGELTTFDLGTGKQNGTTALTGRPCGLAVGPAGTFAAVSLFTGRTTPSLLALVNTQTNKVRNQSENGRAHGPLVLSRDGGKAFVLDKENRRATASNTTDAKPENALSLPDSSKPTCVAFVETA